MHMVMIVAGKNPAKLLSSINKKHGKKFEVMNELPNDEILFIGSDISWDPEGELEQDIMKVVNEAAEKDTDSKNGIDFINLDFDDGSHVRKGNGLTSAFLGLRAHCYINMPSYIKAKQYIPAVHSLENDTEKKE